MSALADLSLELSSAVAEASPWLVAIHARRRIPSSGIILRRGVVVTAHHTVHREDGITVSLHDGRRVPATLAGRDPATDLAVLRLDAGADGGGVARLAAGGEARVGQVVLALGRPGEAVTAALGIVSATGPEWRTWHGGRIDQFIRLDVGIYDGFSGGAALDASGGVLALTTTGLARSAAVAIPVSTVERVAGELLAAGTIRRGFVGLGLQAVRLSPALVSSLSLDHGAGLMVVSVDEGGPAATAGVHQGDIVLRVNGIRVTEPGDVLAQLGGDHVGTAMTLDLIRAGRPVDVSLTVGARPSRGGSR